MAKRGPKGFDRKATLLKLEQLLLLPENDGKSLEDICQENKGQFPYYRNIYKWLEDPEIEEIFTRIQMIWARSQVRKILEIADDQSRDQQPYQKFSAKTGELIEEGTRSDNTPVNRDWNRIRARQWALARLMPKLFGDKLQQEITGKDGGPLVAVIVEDGKKIA